MLVTARDTPLKNKFTWIDYKRIKSPGFKNLGVALSLTLEFVGKNTFCEVWEFDALTTV